MMNADKAGRDGMDVPGPGQTLFSFVRFWARRGSDPTGADGERGRIVAMLDSVDALTCLDREATINAIARELGLDQSGASRLVKDGVAQGLVELRRSDADARQRHVLLTTNGSEHLNRAREWQEDAFLGLTASWTDRRRDRFRDDLLEILAAARGNAS